MKIRILATAAATVTALAVLPVAAWAAEPCPSPLGAANNPAFGTPRACPTAPTTAPKAKGKSGVEVTKEDGRTFYRYGDTSIAVGGTLTLDTTTGRGKPRP